MHVSENKVLGSELFLVCILTFTLFPGIQASAQETSPARSAIDQLLTVAELSSFTATSSDQDVESFLRKLETVWTGSKLITIGQTVEGRPLWALIVEPKKPVEYKPLTALLLGGIHSGECDGKEALLALAREMASGQHSWSEDLQLIWVPNFNADANQRRGTLHRPGQVGPSEGMGLRENAQGLDLNRDFMKVESPEVRSLVNCLNTYDVDVLIDTHTTNGSMHRYALTYDIPHNPGTPVAIDTWLRESLLPNVSERLLDKGVDTFYYGNFDQAHQRWDTYGWEPRYSTEYMGLRGKIGILSESYSYADYKTRFEATKAFVREVLFELTENGSAVRDLLTAASMPPKQLAIQAELALTADQVTAKGFKQADGSLPSGPLALLDKSTLTPQDFSVQLWNKAQGTLEVELPRAYVVPAQYAWAVKRLRLHGIQVHRLSNATNLQVEQYLITEVKVAATDFQFHRMLDLKVELSPPQNVDLRGGCYVILTEQRLAALAAHLLEPQADDSLAGWNFFDPDLTAGGTYPVLRVTDNFPAGKLEQVEEVDPTEQITLERLMHPDKSVEYGGTRKQSPTWLKGKDEYVVTIGRSAVAVDAFTGAARPLNEFSQLRAKLASLEAFSTEQAEAAAVARVFSDDWKFALIPHKRDLYFFDAEANVVRQLTHSPNDDEALAELNPQGSHVAFVRENNLWLVDCQSTEEKQLTVDGSEQLLNGILDWVYQEELYGRGKFKGFWWSPDGRQIAYLQLDQTQVPHYRVSDSTHVADTFEDTRYPKAGDPLPQVKVWIVDVASGQRREVPINSFATDDRLVARVTWSPQGDLWLQVFNRVQNQQHLLRVAPDDLNVTKVLEERSPGWIEVLGVPEFLEQGDFLWLSDLPAGRRHLFRVSASGVSRQLTQGEWDIDSLVGIQTEKQRAFVLGNRAHPTQLQLLAVDLQTGSTHEVSHEPGTHRVTMSKSGKYYLDSFSAFDRPMKTSVHSHDGQRLRIVDAPTSDRYESLDIRPPMLFTIRARDGLELQAELLLPRDYNPQESEKRLPVLFYVYGGPQNPTVSNAFGNGSYWWHQMLCQQGIAVIKCDNRSSRGRGIADTWTIRGDLGRVEMRDLEDAVEWVKSQTWADPSRIAIWGWSYGGYFTSYAMTHSQLFCAGIAGAPVTDWRNYDAIYTERYMDLPQSNEKGYQESSVVSMAGNLTGSLLIIHGEKDDNVHPSNTVQFVNALQNENQQFEMMFYPRNRHGITVPAQKYHMYQMMTNFLMKHLRP
ncbi:MAG: DPP IV N-terminal domain-containing protein [Planctomycetales bacterium]|nr:DPP IV N-terminal domain-containing protein [Planctomycetales bacterium]